MNNEYKKFELSYWKKHKGDHPGNRTDKMTSLFEMPFFCDQKIIADVGCGPHCGILREYPNKKRGYAVDPLWNEYINKGFSNIPDGIEIVIDLAESFKLPELADVIFSINALDHSGNFIASILNIKQNIKDGGFFLLHIHQRKKNQLNSGHQFVTDEELLSIDKNFNIISHVIHEKCPIEGKKYKTHLIIGKKINIIERKICP